MNTEKDYSLLRPFDLEAAKAGHEITNENGDARIYVDGPDYMGQVCVKGCQGGLYIDPVGSLFMSPLCWVEGKPVYKGDGPLYWKGAPNCKHGFSLTEVSADGWAHTDPLGCVHIDGITWSPPKVKRDGWVNVYHSCDSAAMLSDAWPTKEECDKLQRTGRIACVRIEWEEPAGGAA